VLLVALAIPLAGLGPGAANAGAGDVDLPDSIAAIGDSITQATNADLLHFGPSFPGHSWSTGDDSTDSIASHYERLLALTPGIAGRNGNHAVSGARMAHAPGQADLAVRQGADYETVLMGTNDVCASSTDAMTSVADFESSFRRAMATLTGGLPAARILVASIPDLHRLWVAHRGNLLARLTWEWFRICPTMLATATTDADRRYALARNVDYNAALGRVCSEFPKCRFDGNRVFDRFDAANVSIVDWFHPSMDGLRELAEITWRSGNWADA